MEIKTLPINNFEKCISNLLFETNQDYELQELLMKHNISRSMWKKKFIFVNYRAIRSKRK